MNVSELHAFVEHQWMSSILPVLQEYVKIPNQSPAYDPEWQEHGHMDAAVKLIVGWIEAQALPGARLEVVRLAGRTPLLFVEVPGESNETVLLYGHLDKQPPMSGWEAGLSPWTPVLRDGKLYGRGTADDGYAAFAAITAIQALEKQKLGHARCVIIIEACEESGSLDLPFYIDALAPRIGTPSLVVCLDSGCGDYERLWITSSLRGLLNGNLEVSVLTEGVHSGAASGIVPSTFRILRQLLSRIENEDTGEVLLRELHAEAPAERTRQVLATAEVLGRAPYETFPFQPGTAPITDDVATLLLNRTWRPQLEITGAAGLPAIEAAGNVLRPTTSVKLSLRLPPTVDGTLAEQCLTEILEKDPPYGAKVRFEAREAASGWNAPPLAPWLEKSLERASRAFFGRPAAFIGEGGTIPFMAMLGKRFPHAQFMITGVLGPHSNAHGPNEFLHVATAVGVTASVAAVLCDHRAAGAQ